MVTRMMLLQLAVALLLCHASAVDMPYYGARVGELMSMGHRVMGTLYVSDSTHIRLVGFSYDGMCTDGKFLVNAMGDMGMIPVGTGTQVADEMNRMDSLGLYRSADITLTLPQGRTASQIRWFSIWCDSMNAGHVLFPDSLSTIPAEKNIGQFDSKAHGVRSGDVVIVDAKTIRIENFQYDGRGPDAFFLVGIADTPSVSARYWKVPDETGSLEKAHTYTGQTIELTLPDWLTVWDINWLSMYCIAFKENFGHVLITDKDQLMVPPIPNPEGTEYFGQYLGPLNIKVHDVRGDLYIVDSTRLRLRHFYYDGEGPDAFFWVGLEGQVSNTMEPNGEGVALRDERGRLEKLGAYSDADLVISLNDGMELGKILWFSVWCKQVSVDFGNFIFPVELPDVPAPVSLGATSGSGASADDVDVADAMKLTLRSFTYDGATAETYFYVGKGALAANDDMSHRLTDETGGTGSLRAYNNEDVMLMLPEGVSIWDIDWFAVISTSTGQTLASVMVPEDKYDILVPPYLTADLGNPMTNCETVHQHLNVGWKIDGDFIDIELTGALIPDGYMAFGVSGSSSGLSMIGADHTAAYYDSEDGPQAVDYYNGAYSLCSGGQGVCPDTSRQDGADNSQVVWGEMRDGITTVRYRRQLEAADTSDKPISTTGPTSVVWAMGPLNLDNMVTRHQERISTGLMLEFGREAAYNCEAVQPREQEAVTPWPERMLSGETTTTFKVNMGPTGGDKGYKGTTGFNSWGIAWYVNGLLIPELTLKRGVQYTFTVEGGEDPSNQAKFHPFYITNDEVGGYKDKSPEERAEVNIYAGVYENGTYTATGRYCEYIQPPDLDPMEYDNFEDYAEDLTFQCDSGESGTLTWTPDDDTPDLVYYQCYTHNYLGWKIHVVDDYVIGRAADHRPTLLLALLLAIAATAMVSLLHAP